MRRFLYRNFRAFAALEHRLRWRFTPAGRLVLGALAAAAIIGPNTNLTMAYQLFALLLALVAVSMACGVRFRPRLVVRRLLPRFATAGAPLAYRVAVENHAPAPQTGLVLLEDLADPRPSFDEWVRAREPGEARRNWVDRKLGYPRFAWLVSRNRGAVIAEQPLPTLPPGGATEVRIEITPQRRGHLRFTGATIARPDPLGVFRALVSYPLGQSVLVLPRRYVLPDLALPGGRKYQQGGVALASSVGDSAEFVSLRDYRPGDPLRRIHWRSWARVGRPVVKEYQDEFFVRHALVLDTFHAEDESEPFEEAVSVAASFACAVETQETLLDLMFVGPEAYCFTTGRGVGTVERMLEVLACVRPCHERPFHALHHLVVERCATLSGCVAVLLAWDAARRSFVEHLRALGVPTLALVVAEPGADDAREPGPYHRLEVGRIAEGLARL